jgi:hypothetical protein
MSVIVLVSLVMAWPRKEATPQLSARSWKSGPATKDGGCEASDQIGGINATIEDFHDRVVSNYDTLPASDA